MEPDEKVTEPEDEVYGCISSEQTQILSKEDERLVKLINEKAKDKAYRMAFPKRDIKPIPEHGETKIFCYAFPWLFPGGFGDIQDARNTKIQPTTGHTTYSIMKMVDLPLISFGHFSH
jgi:hypothetical protein